jgi:hypothetical protein
MKVENDGNGGAHNYYPVHGQSRESFKTMLDEARETAYESLDDSVREEYRSLLINNPYAKSTALEWVITELLNEHLCLKEMRRHLEVQGRQSSMRATKKESTSVQKRSPPKRTSDVPQEQNRDRCRAASGSQRPTRTRSHESP